MYIDLQGENYLGDALFQAELRQNPPPRLQTYSLIPKITVKAPSVLDSDIFRERGGGNIMLVASKEFPQLINHGVNMCHLRFRISPSGLQLLYTKMQLSSSHFC